MRPRLKVNHIINLQDARYCAAVGIDMISFNLDEIDSSSVTGDFVKEVSGWLSGVETIGEISFSENVPGFFENAKQLKLDYVSLPVSEIDFPIPQNQKVILRSGIPLSVQGLAALIPFLERNENSWIESPVFSEDDLEALLNISPEFFDRFIFEVASPDPVFKILSPKGLKPFAFSLGRFISEDKGTLDYSACDAFVEKYSNLVSL